MQSALPVLWTRPASRGRAQYSASTTYLLVFAIGALLLLGGVSRIYLEHRTTGLERTWLKEKEQLEAARKERENLILERERYLSRDYILRLAGSLELREPLPGQVRRMTAAFRARAAGEPQLADKAP